MEKLSILPQFIYRFDCKDLNLINEIHSTLESEKWNLNATNSQTVDFSLQKNFNYIKLCDWFYICLDQVKSDLNIECDELKITQCWGNKNTARQWHHPHTHPNSVISGIFYVTDSNSKTWFSIPNIWKGLNGENHDSPKLNYHDDKDLVIHKQQTVRGNLIIFPSSLYHSVDEHLDINDARYSISFNTFPSGKVGRLSYLTGLEIEVK